MTSSGNSKREVVWRKAFASIHVLDYDDIQFESVLRDFMVFHAGGPRAQGSTNGEDRPRCHPEDRDLLYGTGDED